MSSTNPSDLQLSSGIADLIAVKAAAFIDAERYDEAYRLLEDQLIELPEHEECLFLMGKLLGLRAEHQRAVEMLERLVAYGGNRLDALFTLAVEYGETGRYLEAVDCLTPLLYRHPDLPFLHRWHGVFLERLKRTDDAQKEYLEALRLKPDYVEAQISLASLWLDQCHMEEAEQSLRQIVERYPDNGTAHNDLGRICRMQGNISEALTHFQRVMELEPRNIWAASNYLFSLCNLPSVTAEDLASQHFVLANRYYPASGTKSLHLKRSSASPIRIGYVSGDFCTHSVSFFIEAILEHHDRARFKLYAYATNAKSDETTERLQELDISWRSLCGLPAEAAARAIANDGIDILVDLSGHTAGNRLDVFALKPAAVQASWIGYPHSTGLQQMDYYISDPVCDPPGMTDRWYSEHLIRLPSVFCCYLPPVSFPPLSQPPVTATGYVTFGCFNSFSKINDPMLDIWASILQELPESRLCLKSASLGGTVTQQAFCDRLGQRGVNRERIILRPFAASPYAHLAQYADVDIALDTFPYHGTTTTCEALWMGVPVITMAGDRHLSRVGAAFLKSVGLPELVGDSADSYVALAVSLAGNRGKLAYLREHLRAMMATSPLMDARSVTRDLEQAFEAMMAINHVQEPAA